MALRGKPTLGPKLPFYAPLPASKAQAEALIETDQVFARILCKDGIGAFLGLPRAQYRISTFGEGRPDVPNSNQNARFSINEQVGEKPFLLTLKPGTVVKMGNYNWDVPGDGQAQGVNMKTLQLHVPGHVTVWQMLRWLTNISRNVLTADGASGDLPGFPVNNTALYSNIANNYNSIISMTTPSGRKYNLRSILYPDPISPIQ